MAIATIKNNNALYATIECNEHTASTLLWEQLSYPMANLALMRNVRPQMFKHWDGIFRLYSRETGKIYKGLLPRAYRLLKSNGHTINNEYVWDEDYDKKIADMFINRMNITLKNSKGELKQGITLLDHQYRAIHRSLEKKLRRFELATSAGKTLFSYALINLWEQTIDGKIVLLVPTLDLMRQAYNDFEIYSSNDSRFSMDNVGLCYGETEKELTHRITIACYKTLDKVSKKDMGDVSAIIVDEAHRCKAKTFQSILSKLVNCENRIGISGTFSGIDGKDFANDLLIETYLGPIDETVTKTAKQLIDDGTSQEVVGRVYFLKHNPDDYSVYDARRKYLNKLKADELVVLKKQREKDLYDLKMSNLTYQYEKLEEQPIITENKGFTYNDEIEYLINNQRRNNFICETALRANGNGLVLIRRINTHGVILDAMLKEMCNQLGYGYYYIHGKGQDKSDMVKREVESSERRNIILANMDMVAEGWSVNNLHFGVMASTMQDSRKFLQLIGRFMRKDNTGITPALYCIGDDLRKNERSQENYSLKHVCMNIETFYRREIKFKTKDIQL